MFRSGDYYQMMNRASCLSLLSNAVLVYNNTPHRTDVGTGPRTGTDLYPEAIAHVSPR